MVSWDYEKEMLESPLMRRTTKLILSLTLFLAGMGLILLELHKTVTIKIGAEDFRRTTFSSTVEGVLQESGIYLSEADQVSPEAGARLSEGELITVTRAARVQIWADGETHSLLTTERGPANLLATAKVALFPGDQVLYEGTPIPPDQPLPEATTQSLQVQRGVSISLWEGAQREEILSNAPTLGAALWQAGIKLQEGDHLNPPPETPLGVSREEENADTNLAPAIQVRLRRARPLKVLLGDQMLPIFSSAATVGEALVENGLSLQGMDYSQPPGSAALPEDGTIRVVRVFEKVLIEQEPMPFETHSQPLPDLELGEQRVIQVGEFGLITRRVRVRYEDGEEVSRREETERLAVEPKPRVVGYGTKIVLRTLDTPSGAMQYWYATEVYATSYSPCRLGVPDYCNNRTALGLPLRQGVVGVVRSWYNALAGSQVFVPGYGTGTIADIGAGISGGPWIDLGYNDENYINWHQNVTVYFLAPAPPVDQILSIFP